MVDVMVHADPGTQAAPGTMAGLWAELDGAGARRQDARRRRVSSWWREVTRDVSPRRTDTPRRAGAATAREQGPWPWGGPWPLKRAEVVDPDTSPPPALGPRRARHLRETATASAKRDVYESWWRREHGEWLALWSGDRLPRRLDPLTFAHAEATDPFAPGGGGAARIQAALEPIHGAQRWAAARVERLRSGTGGPSSDHAFQFTPLGIIPLSQPAPALVGGHVARPTASVPQPPSAFAGQSEADTAKLWRNHFRQTATVRAMILGAQSIMPLSPPACASMSSREKASAPLQEVLAQIDALKECEVHKQDLRTEAAIELRQKPNDAPAEILRVVVERVGRRRRRRHQRDPLKGWEQIDRPEDDSSGEGDGRLTFSK